MFSNANSFKAKIKNISKDKGIPAQQVQQHYLIEQVLKMISTSPYRDSFIVKGGYLKQKAYYITVERLQN